MSQLDQLALSNEIGKDRFKENKFDESKNAYIQTEITTNTILSCTDPKDIEDKYLSEMIKCFSNLSFLLLKKEHFGAAEVYAKKQ